MHKLAQSNLSTLGEPSEMKPNLLDQTCELLRWLCNYRKLPNTTTREQFWQYSLIETCYCRIYCIWLLVCHVVWWLVYTGSCVVWPDAVSAEGRWTDCVDWVSAWCHFRPHQQPAAIQTAEKGVIFRHRATDSAHLFHHFTVALLLANLL